MELSHTKKHGHVFAIVLSHAQLWYITWPVRQNVTCYLIMLLCYTIQLVTWASKFMHFNKILCKALWSCHMFGKSICLIRYDTVHNLRNNIIYCIKSAKRLSHEIDINCYWTDAKFKKAWTVDTSRYFQNAPFCHTGELLYFHERESLLGLTQSLSRSNHTFLCPC